MKWLELKTIEKRIEFRPSKKELQKVCIKDGKYYLNKKEWKNKQKKEKCTRAHQKNLKNKKCTCTNKKRKAKIKKDQKNKKTKKKKTKSNPPKWGPKSSNWSSGSVMGLNLTSV